MFAVSRTSAPTSVSPTVGVFHDINYTGSIKEVLQYDLNKIASKRQIAAHGIETARFFTALPDEYKILENLPIPFPLFIKPMDSANSEGIDENSFVFNFAGFQRKVKELYDIYKQPALVEEYLSGREFTVSIIKTDAILIAPVEIIAPVKNDIRILSKEIKSKDSEILVKIDNIDVYQKVCAIAKASFEALGARDFGRIDIKMDAHERCYFIEANLTPGMTDGSSYFPKSYELCSLLEYGEVVSFIVKTAIKRHQKI
jgi:D-alanine-D-alanine ligase